MGGQILKLLCNFSLIRLDHNKSHKGYTSSKAVSMITNKIYNMEFSQEGFLMSHLIHRDVEIIRERLSEG